MIIPISQDVNKFFVNINGTNYPVKKMLFNGQGVQNVEVYADYYSQYFTIESLEDNNIVTFTIGEQVKTQYLSSVAYSTDGGQTWTNKNNVNYSVVSFSVVLNTGDKLLMKGNGTAYSTEYKWGTGTRWDYSMFSTTKQFKVYGNIMSLLYGDDFEDKYTIPDIPLYDSFGKGSLNALFSGCTCLVDAHNIKLPATNLSYNKPNSSAGCYSGMFNGCTSLTAAPELPATILSTSCYSGMFSGCTSLTVAPKLLATTLAGSCYYSMFKNCSSLNEAPVLPASTLTSSCYGEMFSGCTSLTTAPVLPADTLMSNCYYRMFYGCTSLTTAPELPALILVDWCYYQMFSGCTSLNNIVCLATDVSASSCVGGWLNSVSSTGTFYKNSSMSSWATGTSGIPSNWTVVDW